MSRSKTVTIVSRSLTMTISDRVAASNVLLWNEFQSALSPSSSRSVASSVRSPPFPSNSHVFQCDGAFSPSSGAVAAGCAHFVNGSLIDGVKKNSHVARLW